MAIGCDEGLPQVVLELRELVGVQFIATVTEWNAAALVVFDHLWADIVSIEVGCIHVGNEANFIGEFSGISREGSNNKTVIEVVDVFKANKFHRWLEDSEGKVNLALG